MTDSWCYRCGARGVATCVRSRNVRGFVLWFCSQWGSLHWCRATWEAPDAYQRRPVQWPYRKGAVERR